MRFRMDMALSVGVLDVFIVDRKAVGTGTGVASVKGSVRKAVSEVVLTLGQKRHIRHEPPVPRKTFAVWERIQSGHVALLHTGGPSALVPCIFAAKRVMKGS
jgi:hypothetical protein